MYQNKCIIRWMAQICKCIAKSFGSVSYSLLNSQFSLKSVLSQTPHIPSLQ